MGASRSYITRIIGRIVYILFHSPAWKSEWSSEKHHYQLPCRRCCRGDDALASEHCGPESAGKTSMGFLTQGEAHTRSLVSVAFERAAVAGDRAVAARHALCRGAAE
jgi:hypothetical protein